jgi:PAS domain S-box-containing protein
MPTRASSFSSVGTKLAVATCGVMLVSSVAVSVGLSHFERERTIGAKEQAARMAGELFLRQASTPVVFDDSTGIQETVALLGHDHEVLGIELWRNNGKPIAALLKSGEPGTVPRLGPADSVERRSDRIVFRGPIRDPAGKVIASAAVQYSLARENAGFTALRGRILVGAGGVAAVLTLLLLGMSRRWIVRPLERLLGAVKQVEVGVRADLGHRTDRSEVGRLGDAFARMAEAVDRRERDIVSRNQELDAGLRREAQSRATLASLVNNTENVICLLDAQCRLVVTNLPFQQMLLGLTSSEPRLGAPLLEQLPEVWITRWEHYLSTVLSGQHVRFEHNLVLGARERVLEVSLNRILSDNGETLGITLFGTDITERRDAETKSAALHRELLSASRLAGMTEVATAVLHNVGNVLTSVNVSARLLAEKIEHSKLGKLAKLVALIEEHAGDLGGFFARDPRARLIPEYLRTLVSHLEAERGSAAAEALSLQKNIDHIKAIVAFQQANAKLGGLFERLSLAGVLDEAVHADLALCKAGGVMVDRDYEPLPDVLADRHKVLQIVLNLIRNARQASEGLPDPTVTLRLRRSDEHAVIDVIDHGCGISPENLTKIFVHGFTTKSDGHGFGLHASACAATEMGGSLSVRSDGIGRGAIFTLKVPLVPPEGASISDAIANMPSQIA